MTSLFRYPAPPFVDAPVIVKDFQILHYDDIPILYVGRNCYGQILVCSAVDETDDGMIYFHTYVSESDFDLFLKRKLSYLEVLQAARFIWVVATERGSDEARFYQLQPEDIPEKYLPDRESYCPEVPIGAFTGYSVSIKKIVPGDAAAKPHAVTKLITAFERELKSIVAPFKKANWLQPALSILPSSHASHKINFRIDWTGQEKIFTPHAVLDDYLARVIKYISSEFAREDPTSDPGTFSPLQQELYHIALEVGNACGAGAISAENFRESLYDSASALNEMSEVVEGDVVSIVLSGAGTGVPYSFVTIDREYKDLLDNAVSAYASTLKETVTDTVYTNYRIHVFSLNKDSRVGRAYLLQDDTRMVKVRFRLDEPVDLENTILTDSLSRGAFYNVKAKLTRVRETPAEMVIEYRSIDLDPTESQGGTAIPEGHRFISMPDVAGESDVPTIRGALMSSRRIYIADDNFSQVVIYAASLADAVEEAKKRWSAAGGTPAGTVVRVFEVDDIVLRRPTGGHDQFVAE